MAMNMMHQMSACLRIAARRMSSRALSAQAAAEAPLDVPTPDGAAKSYPAHITDIVNKISKLTLLEVSELNSCLKSTLNIQDAPMMAMGMPMGAMAQAPAQQEEEEEQAAPQVQSLFTVKLEKFDESKKIPLIKEVKKFLEGMNLVQAKKFVESAPQVVKEDLTQEEADNLKKALEAVGATVVVS